MPSAGPSEFHSPPATEQRRCDGGDGFKHVQHECIPQAILGINVICQAKFGLGKTTVSVLSTLQQIEPVACQVAAVVLCHTRELSYQICHEFERFSTYLPDIKVVVFYGGVNIKLHKDLLKNECPHIVVGNSLIGAPGTGKTLLAKRELDLLLLRRYGILSPLLVVNI